MTKVASQFVCQQCGYSTLQWFGKCPSCGEWNSLVEFKEPTKERRVKSLGQKADIKPMKLAQIKSAAKGRISTGIEEFDRVLGDGLVAGSVVLLAGEPGIGKSTLLMQLANLPLKILYISGEESAEQMKLRADRLGVKSENLSLLSETNIEVILDEVEKENWSMVIIDSVQTLWTEDLDGVAGSVGQVKETTAKLINLVKSKNLPLVLVGQVTKEGAIAGPMTLAHMVDVVLFLEGERFQSLRLLRGIKNRYGPTDEVGVFEMGEAGMAGVRNPSELFLGLAQAIPGSVTFCALEGTRPVLVEIQALVTKSYLAMPRRIANGVDYNRLVLLVAVLQKILNLPLWDQDIYLNLAGGFKISEPAADLAICLAIISSFKNRALPAKSCAFGEVGLLGEIRRVSQEEKREKEAKRLGFLTLLTSKNTKNIASTLKFFNQ